MTTGRPRAFDSEAALEKAMRVFWRQGYEGTSLSDLTKAMGINRPSLYAAYGNKEALFRQVLDRYDSGPSAYVEGALAASTARECVERLMNGAADVVGGAAYPGGCLMVQGMLAAGAEAQSLRREMTRRRTAGASAVCARLEQAQSDDELPADCDVRALAGFYITIIRGMAVQGADGASRAELQAVIDMAMAAWPKASRSGGRKRHS